MAVTLTISKTLNGAGIADALAGGSTGLDLGQVINGQYVPIILQSANTGYQDIYVKHDAVIDPIDDYSTYIAEFTGTYGGADSAANDIATLIAKGQLDDESTANNSNGLSAGFRVEHAGFSIGSLGASAFLPSRAQVDIYGKNGTDGIDLASAYPLHVDALVFDDGGTEVDATTPETGKIGISGDSVLGDNAHIGVRFYLEDSAPNGGILQWDYVHSFSFTA